MTESSRPMVAPATNEAGVLSASQQLYRLGQPGWTVKYDRRADTLYLRAPNHGPCISYWLPPQPEIYLRLNVHTGILEGIDFTDFRRVLMKADRSWRPILWAVRIALLMERFGLARGAARKEHAAAGRAGEQAQRLCPS